MFYRSEHSNLSINGNPGRFQLKVSVSPAVNLLFSSFHRLHRHHLWATLAWRVAWVVVDGKCVISEYTADA